MREGGESGRNARRQPDGDKPGYRLVRGEEKRGKGAAGRGQEGLTGVVRDSILAVVVMIANGRAAVSVRRRTGKRSSRLRGMAG